MVRQSQEYQTFGQFFRIKRISLGLSLRSFCERYGYDPGNISRLERDILSPSIDEDKLAGYATALKIKKDSEDWTTFFDLAHISKGTIPQAIRNDIQSSEFLPAFFRTMRNQKIDKDKLKKLVKLLEK